MVSRLQGKRILVLEDEPLIAMMLEDALNELGCVVLGPANDVLQAETLAREAAIDAAILDVHVGEQTSESVAGLLAARGIPYLVASGGDGRGALPGASGILSKPFNQSMVRMELERLFP